MSRPSDLSRVISSALVSFLEKTLPELGGPDWWNWCVVQQLGPQQARMLSTLTEKDLRFLDLETLIGVTDGNWPEIAILAGLGQDARRDLDELIFHFGSATPSYGNTRSGAQPAEVVHRILQHVGADPDFFRQLDGLTPGAAHAEVSSSSSEQSRVDGEDRSPGRITGGDWLIDPDRAGIQVGKALASQAFVGIDFGTSTTVVSAVTLDGKGRPQAEPLIIEQPAVLGGTIRHHLVNTVLAWKRGVLLFGQDAYRLRQELYEGRQVFSSFKMRLGVDLGPAYPETALAKGQGPVSIESPQDATREFFRQLVPAIDAALAETGLPQDRRVAVTVPAAFEANQRRDLADCLAAAGLPVDQSGFIDEPNAAFLSHIHHAARGIEGSELMALMRKRPTRVLVYDFGAGTCDVSVLEVAAAGQRFGSRNLAISRFTALGGDDIDRALAREVLMPRLLASVPGFEPTQRDIDERLLPRLQPTAERLKIAAVQWMADRDLSTVEEMRARAATSFSDQPVPPFRLRDSSLRLESPTVTLGELANVLEPFVGTYDPARSTLHVFGPVDNAIAKSGLVPKDLDAVLFIGGSAQNPAVRAAVMERLPSGVRAIVPRDLRTHVSIGAALHSFGYHAFRSDFIRPIVPEPIFVLTRGGGREPIVPAGAEVPTRDRFVTRLHVARDGQPAVELPICVSNESKLLGLLRVPAPSGTGFSKGEEVLVSAAVTRDKLLDVEARVAGHAVRADLMNPLANQELSQAETRLLEAKQAFNQALLAGRGKPSVAAVVAYAAAAREAQAWETAADMYQAGERLDPSRDFAINITFAYAMAGRRDLARKWAAIAHERQPSAVTAFNLSCSLDGAEKERLLREALRHDPAYAPALLALGQRLHARGQAEGTDMLDRCAERLERALDGRDMDAGECRMLITAAEATGRHALSGRARARLSKLGTVGGRRGSAVFDDDNLVAGADATALVTDR